MNPAFVDVKQPSRDGAVRLGDLGNVLQIAPWVLGPLADLEGNRWHRRQAQRACVKV